MPTITRGAAKDSSDGAPENSAPADATIAGPFDDGDADFDDHGGVDMGTTEETVSVSAMSDQMVEMVKMDATWQGSMVKMEAMQAKIDQHGGTRRSASNKKR